MPAQMSDVIVIRSRIGRHRPSIFNATEPIFSFKLMESHQNIVAILSYKVVLDDGNPNSDDLILRDDKCFASLA